MLTVSILLLEMRPLTYASISSSQDSTCSSEFPPSDCGGSGEIFGRIFVLSEQSTNQKLQCYKKLFKTQIKPSKNNAKIKFILN